MGFVYQSAQALLARNAARAPDRPFLIDVDDGTVVSCAAAADAADRIATLLGGRGVGHGDRVLLLGDNAPEFALAFLGVLRHGAALATVNLEMNERYVRDIIAAVRPKVVLYQSDAGLERLRDGAAGAWMPLGRWGKADDGTLFGQLPSALPSVAPPCGGPDDIGLIFYTSGTEERPKGVVATHATALCNGEAIADALGMGADDRILEYRSLGWYSGMNLGILAPLVAGATSVLAHKFSQSQFFTWIRDHRITIAVGVPAVLNMLLSRPLPVGRADMPALRFVTSSSAPLLVEQWQKFESLYGIPIAQCAGMSEGGWIGGSNERTRRVGTVGRPVLHQDLRIVDADGNPVPAGETGEIEVGGPLLYHGYLQDDGTVARFAGDRMRTGDLGVLDPDGCLRITGRVKELIIRGGVNISPAEIDNVLIAFPGVAEAATIGVPDPIYGEAVVSWVSPAAGCALDLDALRRHCVERLPAFRVPAELHAIAAIPKSGRGKIDRNALRAHWREKVTG
ncbi:MAG: class I adenylate-forming enzyme family protein [Rhodospirillales bacterium]